MMCKAGRDWSIHKLDHFPPNISSAIGIVNPSSIYVVVDTQPTIKKKLPISISSQFHELIDKRSSLLGFLWNIMQNSCIWMRMSWMVINHDIYTICSIRLWWQAFKQTRKRKSPICGVQTSIHFYEGEENWVNLSNPEYGSEILWDPRSAMRVAFSGHWQRCIGLFIEE